MVTPCQAWGRLQLMESRATGEASTDVSPKEAGIIRASRVCPCRKSCRVGRRPARCNNKLLLRRCRDKLCMDAPHMEALLLHMAIITPTSPLSAPSGRCRLTTEVAAKGLLRSRNLGPRRSHLLQAPRQEQHSDPRR